MALAPACRNVNSTGGGLYAVMLFGDGAWFQAYGHGRRRSGPNWFVPGLCLTIRNVRLLTHAANGSDCFCL